MYTDAESTKDAFVLDVRVVTYNGSEDDEPPCETDDGCAPTCASACASGE